MRLLFTHFFVISALLLASAVASAQTGPAARYVKTRHDQVRQVLDRPARNDAARERQRDQVTELIRGLLDLDAMAEQALGRHWEGRSAAERTHFVALLRQLVERSYRENLEGTQSYEVRYEGEEARGDSIVVQTLARSRQNRRAPEIQIDYRLRPEGESYMVEDIVTDGVSLVRNYRNQFDRIIRRDGWTALIERMEQRLAEGSAI
jgi:phospholipid transport system substrate-binding protein